LEPSELRVDEAQPSLPVDDALANAPEGHDGFVAVPKVLAPKEKGGVE
jgi:Asp-tRNA(Asn)/Glu-tRNA(Gln) amidotransferase C subunit